MKPGAVEFPDVLDFYETWLQARLRANGFPTAVVSDVFNAVPGESVWLQRDGGSRVDPVREIPVLRVNCLSDRKIETFSQRVRSLIMASPGEGAVKGVREVTGPTDIPNVKPWRYMLFEVTLMGAPVSFA